MMFGWQLSRVFRKQYKIDNIVDFVLIQIENRQLSNVTEITNVT